MAENSLPEARQLPSIPVEHGHKRMEFQEPENREGEAVIRPRGGGKTDCPAYPRIVSSSSYQPAHFPPAPCLLLVCTQSAAIIICLVLLPAESDATNPIRFRFLLQSISPSLVLIWTRTGPTAGIVLYQYCTPPLHASTPTAAAGVAAPSPSSQLAANMNRHRRWRQNKAELEDRDRLARGEPPKKRKWKPDYHYQCSVCSQAKNKSTGHTQIKGKWYCPASGQTLLQWKESLSKQ